VRPRGLTANSALALSADLAGKAATVVVTAVAARTLSTRDFALLATCLAATGLVASALDAGSQTLLTRDGVAGEAARGSLFRALGRSRLLPAAAGLSLTVVVGAVLGRPIEATLAFLLAAVLAAGMSLSGLARSAQDLRPEAESKLVTGILSVGIVVPVALATRSPALLLTSLAVAALAGLCPYLRPLRTATSLGRNERPKGVLRAAVPLGLLSMATIAYYRSGVIILSVLAAPKETAAYAVAANVAFGLLAVPNAITTGLLPRLSAERSDAARAAVARRALGWTLLLAGGLVLATVAIGPTLLSFVFGDRYASAATPLTLLSIGVLLISASGILGTVLIAARALRPLAVQVVVSLVVNLAALALLVPALGAVGAALATIACEVVGLAVLLAACGRLRSWPLRAPRLLFPTAARQS
jgi:O-antigen/teichoic acid export membrane protein